MGKIKTAEEIFLEVKNYWFDTTDKMVNDLTIDSPDLQEIAKKCINVCKDKTVDGIVFPCQNDFIEGNIQPCVKGTVLDIFSDKSLIRPFYKKFSTCAKNLIALAEGLDTTDNKLKEEVELIAKYISEIDNEIPYSLLVFHPDYQMCDLPITPKQQALDCLKIAKKYLRNVHLGNKFLLRF